MSIELTPASTAASLADRAALWRVQIEVMLWRHGGLWVLVAAMWIGLAAAWPVARHLLDAEQSGLTNEQQELGQLQAALKKRAVGPGADAPIEADPAETLASVLVGHDESGEQVQRIYRLAAANHVAVAQADFQLDGDAAGIERLQISIPTKAGYPQLRRFLEASLRELPNASLDRLALKRSQVGETDVEVKVHLSLWLRTARRPGAGS